MELVNKAAELIRGIENRSTDIGARARTLVHRVLQLAEARIRTVEAERQSAVDAAEIKVEELQDALEQARSRASAAEVQISAAEMRAKAAEARASEAMNALARIEDAIRTQILEPRRDDFSKLTAVA